MAKKLMIVESPTKTKTISQYIGKEFDIVASMGHIRDLPKKDLGIDIENDFKPHYVLSSDKRKVVKKIVDKAQKASEIYIASDNDREGEAIAWHLNEILKKKNPDKAIYRVVFNEITSEAVKYSIEHPRSVDNDLVNAQQARRILDRIVGYKVSPVLWKTIAGKLSAGRVQTVALRILCEREEEIKKFVPKEYWKIFADLKKDKDFTASLEKYDGKKAKIENQEQAEKIYDYVKTQKFIVQDVKQKDKSISPGPPFITSTLQQGASNLLGFSTKKTMAVAQQLYEGVEIKGERHGLITYMRTDSVRIGDKAVEEVQKLIKERFGNDYLSRKRRIFKTKKKSQDAHEAIRPTSSFRTPESIERFLTKDQARMYNLIWKRFVATQMSNAKVKNTRLFMAAGKALFETKGNVVKFEGFMKAYPWIFIMNKDENLPNLKVGEEVNLIKLSKEQKFTQPPPRFTEAQLVKKLESENIGRPSTYAPIISTLLFRKYVELVKKKFYPTELGMIVEKFLVAKLDDFFNVSFTSEMEDFLDEIENGKMDYVKALAEFYEKFISQIEQIDLKAEKGKITQKTDIICEKCGSPMVIKYSKYGKYLACSAFPKCRNTKPLGDDGKVQERKTGEKCPKCGEGDIVLKEGKFGKFYGCSNYPKCKFTRPFKIGVKCPECGGDLIERKNKNGRLFYGCSNYPKCKFITNYKPVNMECPECGAPSMFEKPSKYQGTKLICLKCKKEIIK
ncbi:MAG: type I DNA topoisomerase [Candidatus Cloacimonadota bacterium]|nr:type I DNA topoisomerase [Candidatus Cloacimonadota bacterium]